MDIPLVSPNGEVFNKYMEEETEIITDLYCILKIYIIAYSASPCKLRNNL